MAGTLVGRTVRKEFSFGVLEGKVAYGHRPDGEALLLRVVRIVLNRGENCREAQRRRLRSTVSVYCFDLFLFGVRGFVVGEIYSPQGIVGCAVFSCRVSFRLDLFAAKRFPPAPFHPPSP